MKLTLLMIGKTRENYLKEGIGEYVKRLSRYAPFNLVLVPDVKLSAKAGKEKVKQAEGQAFMQRIKGTDFVVLLDEKGKDLSSVELAGYLQQLEGRTAHVVFIIGGAYGFSGDIYKRSDASLSLSRMTFSHQMVRLIFLEQLYRAFTIQRGEPYHHS
jgi:23S rRNA (pseudouridine1915-N3)-methyltransferase